jgi:hypothetical protein
MLREARDLAVGAADVATAMTAVDALAGSFAVSGLELSVEALTALARKPLPPAQSKAAAEALLSLSTRALRESADLERAGKLVAQAEAPAKKAKDAQLLARVTARRKDLRELAAQTGAVTALLEQLKSNAANSAANLALGRFYCFGAGDWEQGLPLLARGGDAGLRRLAQADLAGAGADGQPAQRVAIGDGWWDLAEKQQSSLARDHLRQRAGHWYAPAVAELAGIERTRVEKRVSVIEAEAAPGGTTGRPGEDQALSLLRRVVNELPADARPRRGQTWDSTHAKEWLDRQTSNTPFAGTLTVDRPDVYRYNGRDWLRVDFRPVGPLSIDGVNYTLYVHLATAEVVTPAVLAKLQRGTSVEVRATVQNAFAATLGAADDPIGDVGVRLVVQLEKPTIRVLAPLPPRPTPAGGARTAVLHEDAGPAQPSTPPAPAARPAPARRPPRGSAAAASPSYESWSAACRPPFDPNLTRSSGICSPAPSGCPRTSRTSRSTKCLPSSPPIWPTESASRSRSTPLSRSAPVGSSTRSRSSTSPRTRKRCGSSSVSAPATGYVSGGRWAPFMVAHGARSGPTRLTCW